jgi:excisionase family DNA binding protein
MTSANSLSADLARVLKRHGYQCDDGDPVPDLLAALVRVLASLRSPDVDQRPPYEIHVELPPPPAPSPAPSEAPERMLLTLTEAADTLRISRTKLYELLDADELTSLHIGRSRRITTEALNAYITRLTYHHPNRNGPVSR